MVELIGTECYTWGVDTYAVTEPQGESLRRGSYKYFPWTAPPHQRSGRLRFYRYHGKPQNESAFRSIIYCDASLSAWPSLHCIHSPFVFSEYMGFLLGFLKDLEGGVCWWVSTIQEYHAAPITHAVGDAGLLDEKTTRDRHTRYWNFHGSAVRRGGGRARGGRLP